MPDGDSLIGTLLDGKYSVDRLLGVGGMGEVYAGTHVALGRLVAIKVLHAQFTINQSFVARFEREARTTAMLQHPNAVHIHDFGTLADGSRYLVMEYIEGVTLRDILRANASVPPGIAVDLIRQAAGAVAEAHARGIIHRDLKPENLMVRRDEDGRLALKVVDFGLAKILENTASLLTNASEIMGTPKYMSPEQFQGMPVDGRADVYALGCVLFELLSGQTPYEGTILEIVGQHVHAEIPLVTCEGTEIPSSIQAVVRRALAKDPDSRTASAEAFARELEEAVSGLDQSIESIVIPGRESLSPADSSGPSDVTAMPEALSIRARTPRSASSDTLAGAYATSSVGTTNATVFVEAPPPARRSWPVPVTLAVAGAMVLSVAMWPTLGARVDSVEQVQPPDEAPAPVEQVPAASPMPERTPESRIGPHSVPSHEAPRNAPPAVSPDPEPAKKDNRGVFPTVGAKTKEAVVGTGRQFKRLGGKIRRGIPGLKPKKNDRR